jgi:hypothetical protein
MTASYVSGGGVRREKISHMQHGSAYYYEHIDNVIVDNGALSGLVFVFMAPGIA